MTDADTPSFVVVTARRASVATRVSRRHRGPEIEIKIIRFLPQIQKKKSIGVFHRLNFSIGCFHRLFHPNLIFRF